MTLLLQRPSVTRDFVLCEKSNWQILAKLAKVYQQDPICFRTVEKLATRFRAGQGDMNDDDRPGKPQTDISDAILHLLEKNLYSSSQDVSKALFIPKTTILQAYADLELKF
jgi:hypothetical protein